MNVEDVKKQLGELSDFELELINKAIEGRLIFEEVIQKIREANRLNNWFFNAESRFSEAYHWIIQGISASREQ